MLTCAMKKASYIGGIGVAEWLGRSVLPTGRPRKKEPRGQMVKKAEKSPVGQADLPYG